MPKRPFDINNVPAATLSGPATYGQCGKVASTFAGIDAAGGDRVKKSLAFQRFYQIRATLYADYAKKGKLSFKQASKLMEAKKLPQKYETAIKRFKANNPQ